MTEQKTSRHLRSVAWQTVLKRLRAEFPDEHGTLCAQLRGKKNATQIASTQLRRRHPERAAEMYREEVAARGLPAPRPQPGRWPNGQSDG